MRILVLNQDWFAAEFRTLGHEVITAGLAFARHLEHTVDIPFIHIDRLIEGLPNGFVPDCILVHDNSAPIALSGFDDTSFPTFFYSVDTHHHAALHRYLYEVFDGMCVAQKDYLPFFHEWNQTPGWFPLWASQYSEPKDEKEHDAVFVGTLNATLNPDRVQFFNELCEAAPVWCTQGQFLDIFPQSEIVINQTVKGDLNFRVFESMMCGAMLLTERSGNGLFDIFEEGKHLVTYEKGNVQEAAEKIRYYLEHRDEARRIAKEGRDAILVGHTPLARAKQMVGMLTNLQKKQSKQKFFSMMVNHACIARSGKSMDTPARVLALTSALKSAEYGLNHKEPMDNAIACHIVIATHDYDKYTGTGLGYDLMHRLQAAYPAEQVLAFALIRQALNRGHRARAEEIVKNLGISDFHATFTNAERIICSLLNAA